MKSLKNLSIFFIVSVLLLVAACSSDSGEIALKVTGNVAKEAAWTESKIKRMDTLDADYTNKDGETSTYTGVPITHLLAEAQPNTGADTVVFIADDGYSAEMTLAELNDCAGCIISPREEGGFSTVMPGFDGKLQVKGVIEIQVK